MTSVRNCQRTMLSHRGGLHQSIPHLECHPPTTQPNQITYPDQVIPVHQRNHPEPGSRVEGRIQPLPKLLARHKDELLPLSAQIQGPCYHRTATGWGARDGSQLHEGTAQQ